MAWWTARTTVETVVVPDLDRAECLAQLLSVAAEAVVLQDEASGLLDQIRRHVPLGETAPRTGRLVRRYFALADRLRPTYPDHDAEQVRSALSVILVHHAHLLTLAMELSAYEWRSPRLRQQVEALDGLGDPGERLERIYADLAHA